MLTKGVARGSHEADRFHGGWPVRMNSIREVVLTLFRSFPFYEYFPQFFVSSSITEKLARAAT
jgi:hypothetical protein